MAAIPPPGETLKGSEATPDDAVERPAVDADLRDRGAVTKQDGDNIREAFAEGRIGVNVPEGVGEAMGREDFVEEDGHLVTEVTAGAGHKLVAGLGSGAAEEHEAKDIAGGWWRPLPHRVGERVGERGDGIN